MAGYIGSKAVSVNTTSATISDDLTVGDDATITGDLTVTGDTVTFTSGNANDPALKLINTTNDTDGAELQIRKDKGAAAADGDIIGLISFTGDDAAQQQHIFSRHTTSIATAADGSEGGKHTIEIATHDAELQTGLLLQDGNAEDEIDVTIGNGAASVTTIAGNATVSGGTLKIIDTELAEASDNFSINIQTGNNDFYVKSGGTIFAAFKGSAKDLQLTSGNLVIGTSGKGIDFSAGAAGTSSSNLLDEYEEGVFTVSLALGSGSAALSQDKLFYTKVGRCVTVSGIIRVDSVSSPSGTLAFNLPFAVQAPGTGEDNPRSTVQTNIVENGNNNEVMLEGAEGSVTINLYKSASGSLGVAGNILKANTTLGINFLYFT